MSASEWAAVVLAGTSVGIVVASIVALRSMTAALAELRDAVEELRRETLPVVGDAQSAVREANAELERVDGLLTSAESISATVDSASRLAYLAFSKPVIKTVAFGAGTSRAFSRLRRRPKR